ncbi:MAG: AzlC family ABC transporter permease, partial [Propionicimonas sp.]|nr:AzlC family ABC transporter permease [Propionicimonas sp.]
GLSIAAAVGVYGVSFGALAVAAGLDVWQACALSALMFTGGSQFAFIGVIAGGGTGAAAWAAATLLGVRNGVYGMQLKALIRPPARLIPLMAHLTIDESTATATAQDDHDERVRGFWTAGLGVFLLWNVFTLIGAVAGDALGDPKSWGLDGAAVAAFLGLLWPRLKGRDPVAIAVVAALVTAVAMPLVPPGIPVLIAAVVTAGWWAWRRRSPRPEPEGGSR